MHPVPITTNPFALMIDPQAIFDRIERSERLERLHRRVCRPLDKPLLEVEGGAEAAAPDAAVDEPETVGPESTDSGGELALA